MIKPYYYSNDFSLYNEDNIKIMKLLEADSIDMIFADPPYFLSKWWFSVHSGKRVSVNKWNWDSSTWFKWDFNFHLKWLKEAKRLLRDNGTIWISGTYHSIYQCWYALQLLGFNILNDICWFKPNATPNLSCRYFTASHETVIWARKNCNGKHYFDYQNMKYGNWETDFLKKPSLQMRSVWSVLPPRKTEKIYGKHPAQKPEELLRRVIIASTQKGDTVLDPFSGSWTTWIIASKLWRKYIGIDKEAEYLNLSILRYQNLH